MHPFVPHLVKYKMNTLQFVKTRTTDNMDVGKAIQLILLLMELTGALTGNILLVLFIRKTRQLHRSASLNYIFNCGLIYIVNAMISTSFAISFSVFKTETQIDSTAPTIISVFVMTFLTMLNVASLAIMLGDRLLIVEYPVKYFNKMTVKKARTAIAITWMVTLLKSVAIVNCQIILDPPLSGDNPASYIVRKQEGFNKAVKILITVVSAMVVVVPSIVLYIKVRKQTRKTTPGRDRCLRRRGQARKIDVSCYTVLVVMTISLMSHFPIILSTVLDSFSVHLTTDFLNNKAFYVILFAQLSSLINPYVFIRRSSVLRRSAARVFPMLRS